MRRIAIILPLIFLFGFNFNPMSESINLSDGQKSAQFVLQNDTNESMAIELTVVERIMNESGVEKLPKTEDLTIFPPQIIIPGGEKRTIRVNWISTEKIKVEKSYRVVAEQLPIQVNEKKKKSGIKMLMKFMAALYVTPADAVPNLVVSEYKSNGQEISLTIDNLGNKHKILLNPSITFTSDGKTQSLKTKDLKGIAGENVLAKSKRIFKIKNSMLLNANATTKIKVDD